MSILVRIIAPILTVALVELFLSKIIKDNEKDLIKNLHENDIEIRFSKVFAWVGIIEALVFSATILGAKITKNESVVIWTEIGFAFFILLGVFLAIGTLAWRIQMFKDKDYFTYRSMIRKTCKIYYKDCLYYKDIKYGIVIQTKSRKIEVASYTQNYEFFVGMLQKHKVKKIVDEKNKRK